MTRLTRGIVLLLFSLMANQEADKPLLLSAMLTSKEELVGPDEPFFH